MNKKTFWLWTILVVITLAVVAYFVWQKSHAPAVVFETITVPVKASDTVPPINLNGRSGVIGNITQSTNLDQSNSQVKYPVNADKKILTEEQADALPPKVPVPKLEDSDAVVRSSLLGMMGKKTVLTFLQLDKFIQRVVVTVDSLARNHAARLKWPVNPTAGQFSTLKSEKEGVLVEVINPDNSMRYNPFVEFAELIDTPRAIQLYIWLYPLFQQAYENIGYPGKYFNDRLVEVLDQLLQTPQVTGLIQVNLLEIKGPISTLQPWVHYQFADPNMEELSAGQKMLVRSGPVNHRRLRAKLMEIRQELVKQALAKS